MEALRAVIQRLPLHIRRLQRVPPVPASRNRVDICGA